MTEGVDHGLVRRFVDDDPTSNESLLQATNEASHHTVSIQLSSSSSDPPKSAEKPHGKPAPLLWCDGIRGVASQIVFTFHLIYWFIVAEEYANTTWYRTLRAGNASVEMFLILSGFVLTVRFFERMQIIERAIAVQDSTTVRNLFVEAYQSMASTGLRRIPRLLGPVAIGAVLSIFISWYRSQPVDLFELAVSVVKTLFIIFPKFNSTLWTLRVELEGSLFTMAFCMILSKLRYAHRVALCLVAIPIFHNQYGDWTGEKSHYFGCFVLGILMANIITKQKHELEHGPLPTRLEAAPVFPRTVPSTLGASLETLGLSLCYLIYHAWHVVHSTWRSVRHCVQRLPPLLAHVMTNSANTVVFLFGSWLFIYRPEYASDYGAIDTIVHAVFEKEHARMLHRVGAVLILYTVCWSTWLQRIFQSRVCRYWGRISFLLYVVHWPVVLFVGDFVKPWVKGLGWLEESAKRFCTVVTYVVATVIAHVTTIYLDEPYVKWLGALEKRLDMKVPRAAPHQHPDDLSRCA
ncbi:hypothetical protein, variant [Aphanomyces invadans]|uniref:Acyltransferase 3 domain-containing protein n=1 Tax=Aphanomyces invadans TaxID=157072 RepID=A0A024U9I6_9STRA|nr:hypothetical protein, variant [Aphanomyces invadans]ETW02899.1 hypothetical protein, variant [Aphanomyces invadans]|eukprot:XP_008868283.1 hypothetical protein, variant [Aphanomyces invadans]